MRTINILNPLSLLIPIFVCNFASVCDAGPPVEYTRVCTAGGQGYFYVPGTDTCLNPMTGKTFENTQYGPVTGESPMAMSVDRALEDAHRSLEGVAISIALPTAIIAPGKTYAIAADFGTFDAYNAAGFGAALKLTDNVQLNAAVGVGFSGHTSAARVGANFSW